MGYKGMESPIHVNIENPVKKKTDKAKLKKYHAENLEKAGFKPPKSPI